MMERIDYRALAELRYRIRVFMSFSETAARARGIEPRQHQLLLAVKGLPDGVEPNVRVLAQRLCLRHHSVVELIDRLQARGLARRVQSRSDRRVALVSITARGERLLRGLSVAHQTELRSTGPALALALQALLPPARAVRKGRTRAYGHKSS